MSHGVLSIARFDTPLCTSCGRVDKQIFQELFEKDTTICGFCGGSILLNDTTWQGEFNALVADMRSLQITRSGSSLDQS